VRIRSIKDYLIGIEHIQRNALTATTNSLPRLPPPQASVLKIFNNSLRKAKAEAAPLVNEDGRNDDDDPMMLMMLGGNTEIAGGGGGEEPGGGGGAPSAEVYDGEEEQKDSGGSGSQDQQELRETGSAAPSVASSDDVLQKEFQKARRLSLQEQQQAGAAATAAAAMSTPPGSPSKRPSGSGGGGGGALLSPVSPTQSLMSANMESISHLLADGELDPKVAKLINEDNIKGAHQAATLKNIAGVFFGILVYTCTFAGVFCALEGWNFGDAAYFAIISASGVGYGDIAPTTKVGRWVIVALLPSAVVFLNVQMAILAQLCTGRSLDAKVRALLKVNLSLEALVSMDDDGDGEVTEVSIKKKRAVRCFSIFYSAVTSGNLTDRTQKIISILLIHLMKSPFEKSSSFCGTA
jgi:hypothetical protein